MVYILLILIICLQVFLIKLQRENNLINKANGMSSQFNEKQIKKIGPVTVRSFSDEELWELEQKENYYEEI